MFETILTKGQINEICPFTESQWRRRREDILEHLKDFMDVKEQKTDTGRYEYVVKGEVPKSIPPLPRKSQMTEKKKEYEEYTIRALGTEFKPNSKARIAREAISDFGHYKYGHENPESVSKRYIKEPFEKYGETNNKRVWVDYLSYEPLPEDTLIRWREILKEEKIDEQAAAAAFYKAQHGDGDISKEKGYYQKALGRFKDEFKYMPVLVSEWKVGKPEK